MKRLLLAPLFVLPLLAGCQYELFPSGAPQPMYDTGAPCGYRAVDAGLCPKPGYKLPPGQSY